MNTAKELLLFFLEDFHNISKYDDINIKKLHQMNDHAILCFVEKLIAGCSDFYLKAKNVPTNNHGEIEPNKQFFKWLLQNDPFFSAFKRYVTAHYATTATRHKSMPNLLAEFWKKKSKVARKKECPELFNVTYLRVLSKDARNTAIIKFIDDDKHRLYIRYRIKQTDLEILPETRNKKKRKRDQETEEESLYEGESTENEKIEESSTRHSVKSKTSKTRPNGETDKIPASNSNAQMRPHSNDPQSELPLRSFAPNAKIAALEDEKKHLRNDFNDFKKMSKKLQRYSRKKISELEKKYGRAKDLLSEQKQTQNQVASRIKKNLLSEQKQTQNQVAFRINSAITMLEQATPSDRNFTMSLIKSVINYLRDGQQPFANPPLQNNHAAYPGFYQPNNRGGYPEANQRYNDNPNNNQPDPNGQTGNIGADPEDNQPDPNEQTGSIGADPENSQPDPKSSSLEDLLLGLK